MRIIDDFCSTFKHVSCDKDGNDYPEVDANQRPLTLRRYKPSLKLRDQLLLAERQAAYAVGWVAYRRANSSERRTVRVMLRIGAQERSEFSNQGVFFCVHFHRLAESETEPTRKPSFATDGSWPGAGAPWPTLPPESSRSEFAS